VEEWLRAISKSLRFLVFRRLSLVGWLPKINVGKIVGEVQSQLTYLSLPPPVRCKSNHLQTLKKCELLPVSGRKGRKVRDIGDSEPPKSGRSYQEMYSHGLRLRIEDMILTRYEGKLTH
jgi:hypothetical protein